MIRDSQAKEQTIETKRGEIRFRRELSQQELGGRVRIPETFSEDEIISVLLDSMEETRCIFDELAERIPHISPFLELGAERGQRSYVLSNEFAAQGFALDLSIDALQFGARLAEELGLHDAPLRICGDAYNLPFRSSSLPFVFCFATLHHFPDPAPVVGEVVRVLHDGGHFYFDGEPTRGLLALSLWTRYGHKLSRAEQVLDDLGILGFVSDGGGIEREYGIIENRFPLKTWVEVTRQFDEVEMRVNRALKMQFNPSESVLGVLLGRLLGGVTSATCRVRKDEPPLKVDSWEQRLICPTCYEEDSEFGLELLSSGKGLGCVHCDAVYPEHNGILMLLSRDMLEKLYPERIPAAERNTQTDPGSAWQKTA